MARSILAALSFLRLESDSRYTICRLASPDVVDLRTLVELHAQSHVN